MCSTGAITLKTSFMKQRTMLISWGHSSYRIFLSNRRTSLERDKVISMFDDVDNFIYWHNWKRIRIRGVLEEIDRLDE
jgi:hypothetical protein